MGWLVDARGDCGRSLGVIDDFSICFFARLVVMDMPISLFVEIPETLNDSLAVFLDKRPEWDQDRVLSAAISLFLLQNRLPEQNSSDRYASQIYLDAVFGSPDVSV
jgi:Protein of unknown function (DUF2811)